MDIELGHVISFIGIGFTIVGGAISYGMLKSKVDRLEEEDKKRRSDIKELFEGYNETTISASLSRADIQKLEVTANDNEDKISDLRVKVGVLESLQKHKSE